MTDFAQSNQAATAIEDVASEWLQRRHFWNWSAADQEELDAWLAQSLTHQLAYWRLEAAWDRSARLQVLRRSTAPVASPTSFGAQYRPLATRIAVVAVFVAACVFGFSQLDRPQGFATYKTAPGGHKVVSLSDGTEIELNTDTVLRVASANPRNVWLDKGEAYFQVRHDAANPFTVVASGHRITDLGTKFLLRAEIGKVDLSLIEGRARIDSVDAGIQPHSAVLSAGQVATATPTSLVTLAKSGPELASELGWRRGVIVFHHTTLDEVVADFNRYGNGKIVIADPAVGQLMLNGTFPTHDTDTFIRIAQQVFRLKVNRVDGRTVLSR